MASWSLLAIWLYGIQWTAGVHSSNEMSGMHCPIVKSSGCNYTRCPRCQVDWCFFCRTKTSDCHKHFNSLFGCFGMHLGCGRYYFLILIIWLLYVLIMPLAVNFVMFSRMMNHPYFCFECCFEVAYVTEEWFIIALLIG